MIRIRLPPPALRCDVPGCPVEIALVCGDEQRCMAHAVQRANEERAAVGLPPMCFDERGEPHVQH